MDEVVLGVLGDAMGKAVLDGVLGETLNVPVTVLVILGAGLVLFVILFLARFGKMLAKVALVICGLLLVGAVAALLFSSQATATPTAATSASVGQAATSAGAMLCAGGLGAVALLAVCAAGVFYVRWQFDRPRGRGRLSYRPQRQSYHPPAPEIVYLATDYEDDLVDDFSGWGW